MNDSIRACLYDMRQAVLEMEGFFAGQPMLFAAYQAMCVHAVPPSASWKLSAKQGDES